MIGIVEVFQYLVECWRCERQTIAPAHGLEMGIDFIKCSVEHVVGDALCIL